MLATYKLTIKNEKEYITTSDMFRILYVKYLSAVRRQLEKNDTIYEEYRPYSSTRSRRVRKIRLAHHIKECGQESYETLLAVFMSRKMFEFIDWKPHVKTINLQKLTAKLKSTMRLSWNYYHGSDKTTFRNNDHYINILWHLWERGMFFNQITDVPKCLIKFTRVFLYIEYYLEKIFEYDYVTERMNLFSCDPKETFVNQYYRDSYGRYRYHPSYYNPNFEFDNHEYNSRSITMPTASSVTTGDYSIWNSSGDDATAFTVNTSDPNGVVYVSSIYDTSGSSGTTFHQTTGGAWS